MFSIGDKVAWTMLDNNIMVGTVRDLGFGAAHITRVDGGSCRVQESSLRIATPEDIEAACSFFASIGMKHSDMAQARGVVTEVSELGKGSGLMLARIDWGKHDMPERVNVQNLAKVGANARFSAC